MLQAKSKSPGASLPPRRSALFATSSRRAAWWDRSQATTAWSPGRTPARASRTSSTASLRCNTLAVRPAVRAWMLLSDCGSSPGSPQLTGSQGGQQACRRGCKSCRTRARGVDCHKGQVAQFGNTLTVISRYVRLGCVIYLQCHSVWPASAQPQPTPGQATIVCQCFTHQRYFPANQPVVDCGLSHIGPSGYCNLCCHRVRKNGGARFFAR